MRAPRKPASHKRGGPPCAHSIARSRSRAARQEASSANDGYRAACGAFPMKERERIAKLAGARGTMGGRQSGRVEGILRCTSSKACGNDLAGGAAEASGMQERGAARVVPLNAVEWAQRPPGGGGAVRYGCFRWGCIAVVSGSGFGRMRSEARRRRGAQEMWMAHWKPFHGWMAFEDLDQGCGLTRAFMIGYRFTDDPSDEWTRRFNRFKAKRPPALHGGAAVMGRAVPRLASVLESTRRRRSLSPHSRQARPSHPRRVCCGA